VLNLSKSRVVLFLCTSALVYKEKRGVGSNGVGDPPPPLPRKKKGGNKNQGLNEKKKIRWGIK